MTSKQCEYGAIGAAFGDTDRCDAIGVSTYAESGEPDLRLCRPHAATARDMLADVDEFVTGVSS